MKKKYKLEVKTDLTENQLPALPTSFSDLNFDLVLNVNHQNCCSHLNFPFHYPGSCTQESEFICGAVNTSMHFLLFMPHICKG